jgi:hypothetical protein
MPSALRALRPGLYPAGAGRSLRSPWAFPGTLALIAENDHLPEHGTAEVCGVPVPHRHESSLIGA